MQKICKHCQISFEITQDDLDFYEKISPEFNGKKYHIPNPTLCHDCRQQRKLSFRIERKFYKRNCSATGCQIISVYSPDKPYKVYKHDVYYSDKWNPLDYGRDFDFNKCFFEQFKDLHLVVPKSSLFIFNNENCEYTNLNSHSKNCYLVVASSNNENCYYSTYLQRNTNLVDGLFVFDSEIMYECIDCNKSYKLFFSQSCEMCSDSYFLYNCQGCKNCYGCVNLINKEYYIFNEKYSKEEYFNKINEIKKDSNYIENSFIKFNELKGKLPHKFYSGVNNINVTGDYILFSKDTFNSYDCTYLENCNYCTWLHQSKDCYDHYAWGLGGELGYENHLCGNGFYRIAFCETCGDNCSNLFYCRACMSCSYCFGCIGLSSKSYCILNKQYTKEEYEELVPKIIEHMMKTPYEVPLEKGDTGGLRLGNGINPPTTLVKGDLETTEWGEFFPSSISPFGYNETVAQEYFPLSKEEAITKGFNWSDFEVPFPKTDKIILASKLPQDINKIPDDILNWAIECEITKRPFRIIPQELEFYRKHNLPIPHLHPDERHRQRMLLRNPRKLYNRKCDKCKTPIVTTFAPDRSEIVYCDECYEKEVY